MRTQRDFDRVMEAFLDEGPNVVPDRLLAAIRDDVERIEIRARGGSWRNPFMLRATIAAVVVVAVLIGGFAIYSALDLAPDIGPPADESEKASSSELPPELQFSFVGPAKSIPGVDVTADRGDIRYENLRWRFEAAPGISLLSTPTLTAGGDIRLTTRAEDLCAVGDEGTYPWSLANDGTILTIETGTDDCAARQAAMPGTYQRAACRYENGYCLGELGAGTYVSHVFEPRPDGGTAFRHGAMSYTVPSGWAAYEDGTDLYGLTPQVEYAEFDGQDCYDCPATRDTITVLSNPGAATEDCGEEMNVPGIGFRAQDLVDWLTAHPGLVASEPEATTVGGLSALSLIIEGADDWPGTCDEANPFPAVPVFYRLDSYHWALKLGERYHVTLVDLGDEDTLAIVVDSGEDEDLEALVETARPIIESFEFPPR